MQTVTVRTRQFDDFNLNQPVYINDSDDAARLIASRMKDLKHENVVVLYLDEKKRLLGSENYISNSPRAALLEPAEILKTALLINAKNVILGHNHPSAIIAPSQKDIRSTAHIKKACWYANINLLDHLILNGERYCSFKNFGLV